jgi:hypothetical protein
MCNEIENYCSLSVSDPLSQPFVVLDSGKGNKEYSSSPKCRAGQLEGSASHLATHNPSHATSLSLQRRAYQTSPHQTLWAPLALWTQQSQRPGAECARGAAGRQAPSARAASSPARQDNTALGYHMDLLMMLLYRALALGIQNWAIPSFRNSRYRRPTWSTPTGGRARRRRRRTPRRSCCSSSSASALARRLKCAAQGATISRPAADAAALTLALSLTSRSFPLSLGM